MSEPFRTRDFRPVEPHARPRRTRRAARVVILAEGRVLMLADTDPGLPGSRWWTTPGGGIDPGETSAQAAAREILEETGRITAPGELLGPVAVRAVVHGFSDQILAQQEEFFVLPLDEPYIPAQDGFTAEERITMDGWAWLSLTDLPTISQPIWPADLAAIVDLADHPERWPLQWGDVEESTVPVG